MSTRARGPRLLCVDDEPAILDGLRDQLHRTFDVDTVENGADALARLKARPAAYAVVISDMRMPGMSGAVVLREARRIAPLTVRILLTGYADTENAIRAVNDGQIFRFLSKPCPSEQLVSVCSAAVGRHRLLCAEQRVLDHAQYDTIEALVDLFAQGTPERFAGGLALSRIVGSLAREAGVQMREAELAAKLTALPRQELPEDLAVRLPVLANLLDIVRAHRRRFDSIGGDGPLSRDARALRVVADYAQMRDAGAEPERALARLRETTGVYDPDLLDALARTLPR